VHRVALLDKVRDNPREALVQLFRHCDLTVRHPAATPLLVRALTLAPRAFTSFVGSPALPQSGTAHFEHPTITLRGSLVRGAMRRWTRVPAECCLRDPEFVANGIDRSSRSSALRDLPRQMLLPREDVTVILFEFSGCSTPTPVFRFRARLTAYRFAMSAIEE
jgi:hypothetical protein